MPQYRLTILDPLLARVFDVPLGVTLIGREPSANLPVVNTQVSRRHAHLVSDGQICELIDLGSANGTFVNGERLIPQAPVTLEDGMRLRIGPVELSVEVLPDPPQPEPENLRQPAIFPRMIPPSP
jgi:pSer/pThr/pTyr-binding forkhead associated (FHA) protein